MLELRGIDKSLGPVHVLRDVALDLAPGEVHGLCGENGAGKSTTMRIITGLVAPDAGEMRLDGEPYRPRSYRDARRAGVDIIHQEIQTIPEASVGESILIDRLASRGGLVDWRRVHAEARRHMAAVGLNVSPTTPMRRLSPAQKQLAQVARALAGEARVLLFDEPTSSLTAHESANLFAVMRRLRGEGRTLVLVSHKLDEVLALCDRVTVLRDGQRVASRPAAGMAKAELVRLMIGRDSAAERFPAPAAVGAEVLAASGLARGTKVRGVDFQLRRGEVLGFYGLVGSGRTETARLLVGADRPDRGTVRVNGRPVRVTSVGDAIHRHRVGYVTENRKEEGLFLGWPIVANVTVTIWQRLRGRLTRRIDPARERDVARRWATDLGLRARDLDQRAGDLSGGNQQKVSLAKWLAADCDVLIIDEPTVGVDVGAKDQIHRLIDGLARGGKSILLISSDLPEMVRLASRVLVFRDGRIVGEVADVSRTTYEDATEAIGRFLA